MWIAEEAATAPLPTGWSEGRDPEGNAYYIHSATGESRRQHPHDHMHRELIAQSRLEGLHTPSRAPPAASAGAAPGAATPSHGQWSTAAMRSIEQTLTAAASLPVNAVVTRLGAGGDSAAGATMMPLVTRFSFDIQHAEREGLRCFSATYRPGRAPHFDIRIEQGSESGEHRLCVVSSGRYVLERGAGRHGGSRADELAVVFNAPERDGEPHTLELIIPHAAAGTPRPSASGLLARYARGETSGLLVFLGRVEWLRGDAGDGLGVRLSLPKTDSGNLLLRLPQTRGACAALEYREPISPIQAFNAALALMHWNERGAARSK